MGNYTWRLYDIERDDWDDATRADLVEALSKPSEYEIKLEFHSATDTFGCDFAFVKNGMLPQYMVDGKKIAKRMHTQLENLKNQHT